MPHIFSINLKTYLFNRWKSSKDIPAHVGDSADFALVEHAGEMGGLTLEELVRFWNKHVPKEYKRTRFKHLDEASSLCFTLMTDGHEFITTQTQEDTTMAKTSKKKTASKKTGKKTASKKTKPATKEAGAKRGRKSYYNGGKIKPAASLKGENPSRDGSKRHKAFEIIRKHPKGLSYDDYIAKGGTRTNLAYFEFMEQVTITGLSS